MSLPTWPKNQAAEATRRITPARIGLIAAAALLLASCLSARGPVPVTTSYDLDYPPPSFAGRTDLETVVAVDLVAGNEGLQGTDMLYQNAPHHINSYNYSRWIAAPPDLVASFLVRDMERSGLFGGVFSYRYRSSARFVLFGTLEAFLEVDDGQSATGRISMTVALFDNNPLNGAGQAPLFQRHYDAHAVGPEQTAGGLAASLSEATRQISLAVINDVYEEINRRLSQ